MTLKVKRGFLLVLLLLGFVLGCGKGEPELKMDPALANKPFPEVERSENKAVPPPAAFPRLRPDQRALISGREPSTRARRRVIDHHPS